MQIKKMDWHLHNTKLGLTWGNKGDDHVYCVGSRCLKLYFICVIHVSIVISFVEFTAFDLMIPRLVNYSHWIFSAI